MNIQAMMAQAKKLQSNLEKTSREIELKEFEIDNENIKITMTGDYNIKNISIKNKDLFLDSELLEEVIMVSLNDLFSKVKKEKNDKLGKYTNGLGGLF